MNTLTATKLASTGFEWIETSLDDIRASNLEKRNARKAGEQTDATLPPGTAYRVEGVLKPSLKDRKCAFCGKPIPQGSLCHNPKLKDSFTDWPDLCDSEGIACPDCTPWFKKENMGAFQFGVITADRFYPTKATYTLAETLLNPPEPPFAWAHSTLAAPNNMHIIWKTPVTLDRNFIHLQLGNKTLLIVRKSVIQTLRLIHENRNAEAYSLRPESLKKMGLTNKLPDLTAGSVWAVEKVCYALNKCLKDVREKKEPEANQAAYDNLIAILNS